ncbi:periplasmic heavy metal sensor [Acetobacter sp. TBRC 12305]|uniref:Periplasmic heavy metal sensor n=1 Tax=Acetobacter garciniae TaxID=2817435 RepID=A0A939HQ05_9PROT|nr:periplasmic heavy metal sensor [Acetobacter garciniae]MBO1325747.1 periplasmic heavy metal sensor [Acetobacter garciniae]MBX0345647.1 periplasmic heavy metal sensor [Acetobacter garciniae]
MKISSIWRGLFVLSVLLNLFFVALNIGHHFEHHPDGPPPFGVMTHMFQHVGSRLSPADAQIFQTMMQQEGSRYTQAREELMSAQDDLNRLLLDPNFDAGAVHAAMLRRQAAWDSFVGGFNNALVDAMNQMTPQGRRSVAHLISHRRPHGP